LGGGKESKVRCATGGLSILHMRNDVKNTKITCVTGASGMIGLCITKRLLEKGYIVRVLTRSATFPLENVVCFQGSLSDVDVLESMLDSAEVVFHCAGELHDESKMYDVNVLGTERLARVAAEHGVGSFVHISSAGVTGPANTAWVDEATPCHPSNAYEVSKWEAEQRFASLNHGGMRLCILRPANVVDDERPGVLAMALRNVWTDRISLLIKGGESAHLVHAEDVAGAALFLAENETCSGTYLVGCDEDDRNTIAGVFNLARRKLGIDEYKGPVFSAAIPYYLRCMRRGKSLHGRTQFSSARLIGAGFEFPLGLEAAIERVCACHGLNQ